MRRISNAFPHPERVFFESLDDEGGIQQIFLVVEKSLPRAMLENPAPRFERDGVGGGSVPLHRGSETRIDVGRSLGNKTKLERAARGVKLDLLPLSLERRDEIAHFFG